jgi:hypothetical protein
MARRHCAKNCYDSDKRARIAEWLPVWLSKSEGSDATRSRPCSSLLTCIGFRPGRTLNLWEIVEVASAQRSLLKIATCLCPAEMWS